MGSKLGILKAKLGIKRIECESVAQFAGAVLIGEQAPLMYGKLSRLGGDPLDRHYVFGGVLATDLRVMVVPGQWLIGQLQLLPVNGDQRILELRCFTGRGPDAYVPGLRDVGEDSGADREAAKGPGIPGAAASGDEAIFARIIPVTPPVVFA